jgi:hypothetical protein
MLAAIGALAFIAADVVHEALGHGTACLAWEGRVRLLTAVYFRCDTANWMTDLAGPSGNAFLAGVCAVALRKRLRWAPNTRLLLVFVLAFNGCWASGYAIYTAVSIQGDLAFLLRDLAPANLTVARFLMGLAGLFAYLGVTRYALARMPRGVPVIAACLTAVTLSCVAAACFSGAVGPSLREGLFEGVGASLGLLIAARRVRREGASAPASAIEYSSQWLAVAALIVAVYLGVLGHGIGDPSYV